MTLETESVLDRRNLRRRVGLWRGLAIAAGVLAVGALASHVRSGGLGDTKHIARITIEGMITEDRDMLRLLKRIGENKNVQGVVLFINSPGGTTTGGEALFEAVREVAKTKPVVAQFGTVAASAAYITGLACDHIVARGNSITGSVGVIFQWPEVSGLLDKFGVKMNEIKSGPLKAVPSMFEPVTPQGRKVSEEMVAESQKWFLNLVTTRRGVVTADIPGLEQGRIYSGREALQHKLVDSIGGESEVLKYLEDVRKTPKSLKIVDWRPRRDTDFGWLRFSAAVLGRMFGSSNAEHQILNIQQGFSASLLDGLVSVWQPAEK
jgi:protease IV